MLLLRLFMLFSEESAGSAYFPVEVLTGGVAHKTKEPSRQTQHGIARGEWPEHLYE